MAADTATAILDEGAGAIGVGTAAGGTGVITLRVTGASGNATGTSAAGGGSEKRGTGGRSDEATAGLALGGGGSIGLLAMGAAGAGGVEVTSGRDGAAAAYAGGVAIGAARAGVGAAGAMGVAGAAGLPTTGGLTEGKPIMVRLRGLRPAPGAGGGTDG